LPECTIDRKYICSNVRLTEKLKSRTCESTTLDRKRIYTNPSSYPNPNSNSNTNSNPNPNPKAQ